MSEALTVTQIGKYKVHPLAALFPMLSGEDYLKFKADIQKHGLLEPIITEGDGNVVIDGRNRLRACEELGIPPRLTHFSQLGKNNLALTPEEYIWSHNVLRRHLTDDQRAMLVVQFSEATESAKAKLRMTSGKPCGESATGSAGTRKELAKQARVSTHKVRQAQTVAKRKPELGEQVREGKMSLKESAKQATAIVNSIFSPEKKSPPVAQPAKHPTRTPEINVPRVEVSKAEETGGSYEVGFRVKSTGTYASRRWTQQGAKLFAAALISKLQENKIELCDQEGRRLALEINNHLLKIYSMAGAR